MDKAKSAQTWLHEGLGRTYTGLNCQLDGLFGDYKQAIDHLKSNSLNAAVTVFTPDDTHYDIAMYAVSKGVHVMLAKPAVHSIREHVALMKAAEMNKVIVCVEFHKRFDPIYADAVHQMRHANSVGDFGYFYAYMSQPKYQLRTFQRWAGLKSDISFYLNSHHIDLLTWAIQDQARPVQVAASAATGVASSSAYGCVPGTEDTITLMVTFALKQGQTATAVFTSSWTAPDRAECHSQQRFHFLGSKGEVRVDQAHRGYELVSDEKGFLSRNPLFMKYTPDAHGMFRGQQAYGYRSFKKFVQACRSDWQTALPEGVATLKSTLVTTAILEAGRKSLDSKGMPVRMAYEPESGEYRISE
jgi:D-galacturonate reductase